MAKEFFFMGRGAGDTNRAALNTWTGQPKTWGDVAAPRDWLQSHPDAQNRYRQGNPYYVTIPGAPPGPFGGKYRVSDARPAKSVNQWEFNLPEGMSQQDFYNRPPARTAPARILAPNELPQPIAPAPTTFTPGPFELGRPNPNPPPSEGQQYPIPVTGPNPVPNEQQYPTPVDTYTPPAVYNPSPNEQQYPTPITTPYNPPVYDYNINPTPNDFFRGQTPYNPPVYDQSSPAPIDVYQPDYYNPPPNETQYPTPIEQPVNPAPNEDMLPTPIDTYQPDLSNPAPNEDMTATPVDMYYPSGDGTYTPLDENGNPIPEPAPQPAPEKPLPPMPSGTVDLPISRPWTSVRDIGGYRWVGGTGQYPTMPPQWLNNLVGAYGVGGGGGSYFGGSSNWSPLPGSFTPTSFGGSGTIYSPFQAGGPSAYGPYGVIQAGGGTGGTGKSPTSSQ